MSSFAMPRPGQTPVPLDPPPEGIFGTALTSWADGDAHRCLAEIVDDFKPQIRAKRVQVSFQFLARDYRLARPPERLRQVFSSLMRTALGSTPAGGQITVRSTCPSEGVLRVEITEHRRGRKRAHPVH